MFFFRSPVTKSQILMTLSAPALAIVRLSRNSLMSIVAEAAETGQIIGVPIPSTDEDDEPWDDEWLAGDGDLDHSGHAELTADDDDESSWPDLPEQVSQ